MFAVHLLRLNCSTEEMLKTKLAPNACFVILSSEFVCVPRFVEYAFMKAFKSCEAGKNTANTLSLEWLCNLSLTKNVSNAVNFTKPSGNEVALACVNCFEKTREITQLGAPVNVGKEFREKAVQSLKEKYRIPPKAVDVYSLEDLLIEKAAVENL